MFNLQGEIALVVGGAGGIGSACAIGLAQCGANIVIADLDLEKADRVTSQIKQLDVDAMSIQVDIFNSQDIECMVGQVIQKYGKIDILLNNAATTVRKSLLDTSLEEWNRVVHTNLTSAFMLSKVIGREFIKNRKGKMIHMASTGGIRASANFSAYGASKAGLIHLVKTLALEWAPYQINVNSIAPTATETPFTADYYAENPDKKERAIQNHPYKRLGQPADYVGAAIFLASSASNFVNGEVIVVDSGKTV